MSNEDIEDVIDQFAIPHAVFLQDTLYQKIRLARHILSLEGEELLLSSTFSFSYSSVISGISQKNIEYIAKKAPKNYKTELFEAIKKDYIIKEVSAIARAMDRDLGENVTQNQQRVTQVIQYIKDNQAVFQF